MSEDRPKSDRSVSRKKAAATTRSTAGLGYDFEDLVAAWFLTKVLCGESITGVGTGVTKQQAQTEALGWKLDDLLFTAGENADPRRLALSCKSNMQVNASGFPAEFVERAWQQWDAAGAPMSRAADTLGLVTRGRHPSFDLDWTEIVNDCAGSDLALALARIEQTPRRKTIFESIRCPGGVDTGRSGAETIELIRRIVVIPLDFQLHGSTAHAEGTARCRSLLRSNDQAQAEGLWAEIVSLARDTRLGSGTLTIAELWSKLRRKFELKDLPDFDSSWRALEAITEDNRAAISATLPPGFTLPRTRQKDALTELIREQPVSVVLGESGSGKSALVKSTLDERFPRLRQVWLGPEELANALSAAKRSGLGLTHRLGEVLQATSSGENFLVLDSVERLPSNSIALAKALIDELAPLAAQGDPPWRVVVISQTAGWGDRAQMMLGPRSLKPYEIGNLSTDEVRQALRATDLRWLADSSEALVGLQNLKSLAWVASAPSGGGSITESLTSPPAIADHVWRFWTQDQPAVQGLLMRLAQREANFERSFPLSELDANDTSALQLGLATIPLRKTKHNRLEFEHDLASDWARYQRLKEMADDHAAWTPLANNPLWNTALRMFGQFLLRDGPPGQTKWDQALAVAEASGDTLASDLLLDALCLDPQAETFLAERSEFLFANGGQWLPRLLRRFMHVATFPSPIGALGTSDLSLGLYFQAMFRTPVYGRWPPIARFLHSNLERVVALISPTVSEVCRIWLTQTPLMLDEQTYMPFRSEFSEIALANARAVQVDKDGRGVMYWGDNLGTLQTAALAAAADRPEEVARWALEMVQRRDPLPEIATQIAEARAERAAERKRQRSTRSRAPAPISISDSRPLPPWPLGPRGRIDHDFRKAATKTSALVPLMRSRPEDAAEILLALIIEDQPTERYSSHARLDDELGLEYDQSSYPTAYWKSPFFQFLQINPDLALDTLLSLVRFCTERWAYEWARHFEGTIPTVDLTFPDGTSRSFVGNWRVFDWNQQSSTHNGQLHSALNALEKWLIDQIDAGRDIVPYVDRILAGSASVSVLGVLVNIAKYRPELLAGPLMPLVSAMDLFQMDTNRVQYGNLGGDFMSWAREGELIFEAAKQWLGAPHKHQALVDVVGEPLSRNPALAEFAASVSAGWPKPNDEKGQIELRAVQARLDARNYSEGTNPDTGEATLEFEVPEDLALAIAEFQQKNAPTLRNIMLPMQLEQVLQGRKRISPDDLPQLAALLAEPKSADETEQDDARIAIAIAATLAAIEPQWEDEPADTKTVVRSTIRTAVDRVPSTIEEIRRQRINPETDELKFAAYGAMHLWLQEGPKSEWGPMILKLLTSGDNTAAAIIGSMAYAHRDKLGDAWWRIMQLGMLSSVLFMLGPNYGDPSSYASRWHSWLARFRRFALTGASCGPASIDPIGLSKRMARLELDKWRRAHAAQPSIYGRTPEERVSGGLQTDFLKELFGWMLRNDPARTPAEAEWHAALVFRFWDYEVHWCRAHADDDGQFRLPYQFGYAVAEQLARIAAHDETDRGSEAWRRVLSLGPAAHVMIDHFLLSWFIEKPAPDLFAYRWREMTEFALTADWTKGRFWFRGEGSLRQLLSLGSTDSLKSVPSIEKIIEGMGDLFIRWAADHLAADDDNVAAFCNFLTSDLGRPLRLAGLKLLSEKATGEAKRHSRRDRAGENLVTFIDKLLEEDSADLKADADARDAVLKLAALLAAENVTAALALQERVRQVLR